MDLSDFFMWMLTFLIIFWLGFSAGMMARDKKLRETFEEIVRERAGQTKNPLDQKASDQGRG